MSSFFRFFSKCTLVVLLGNACVMTTQPPLPDKPESEWFESAAAPARGVVILVHGLNNHPGIMHPLAGELRRAGYHTLVLGLAGHRGENWGVLDYAEEWRESATRAIRAAKARFPELPLAVVGYSLGATVLLAAMSSGDSRDVERGAFLAPAIEPTRLARLLQIFFPLRHLRLKLPTMVPKEWRANNWTPVAAYHALSLLVPQFDLERLRSVPMCFVLDPDDELIDYDETVSWIERNEMTNIDVSKNSPDTKKERHHLIFSPEVRGEESWKKLVEATLRCFEP